MQVRELRAEMKQKRALNERLRSLAESVRQISGCPDEVYAILDEAPATFLSVWGAPKRTCLAFPIFNSVTAGRVCWGAAGGA